MKKVVEKVQRENEQLKKASGILTSEKMANIEQENEKLKVIFLMLSFLGEYFTVLICYYLGKFQICSLLYKMALMNTVQILYT